MDVRTVQKAYAKHLLDQEETEMLKKVGYPPTTLEELFFQIPIVRQLHEMIGHPCYVNHSQTCSRNLNDSCEGCPEYKEKDGE